MTLIRIRLLSLFSSVLIGENETVSLHNDKILDFLQQEAAQMNSALSQEYSDSLTKKQQLSTYADILQVPNSPTTPELIQVAAGILSQDLTQSIMLQADKPLMTQWDSHEDNSNNQHRCYKNLFDRLNFLMETLESTDDINGQSLLETTTIIVASEMGRTPKYNSAQGKDHWPYTSMMMLGAGIQGGRVVGRTDDYMMGKKISLSSGEATENGTSLTIANCIAGLLNSCDIDSAEYFPESEPFTAPFG